MEDVIDHSMFDLHKLGSIQFIIISCMISGVPYGNEYMVKAAGTGYALLFIFIFMILITVPLIFISCELAGIIPSNHGVIAWVYRGYHSINKKIGDFMGFINALNVALIYCIAMSIQPLIIVKYLATTNWVGELTYGWTVLYIEIIVMSGIFVGVWNVSIMGTATNVTMVLAMLPIIIGFFVATPHMDEGSIIGECGDRSWVEFLSACAYTSIGYERLGSMMGEVSFDLRKLHIYYGISVILSTLITTLPILVTSTYFPECNDWYDGLFATGYGRLWHPLYSMVLIGAIFCNLALYYISVAICSRTLWAMAQEYILIDRATGAMIIPAEQQFYDTLFAFDDDFDDSDDATGKYQKIEIGILPAIVGSIWERTGSPWVAVIVQGIFNACVALYPYYYGLTEFLMFLYLFSFIVLVGSFLIMKYKERNSEMRLYEVPFGKVGAWVVGLMLVLSVLSVDIIAAISSYDALGIAVLCNVVFVIYYYLRKWYWKRLKRKMYLAFVNKESDDDDDELRPLKSDNNSN